MASEMESKLRSIRKTHSMARHATIKQRKFAKEYVKSGNGTQAALKHYDTKSPEVAAVIATENLSKPNVRELIDGYADKAIKQIQTLAETAENESVRLKANIDQADRAGYVAIAKSVNMNVEVEALPEIRELAKKLNALYGSSGVGSDGTVASVVDDKAQDKE